MPSRRAPHLTAARFDAKSPTASKKEEKEEPIDARGTASKPTEQRPRRLRPMSFRSIRLDELDPISVAGVNWLPLRHTLGVQALGLNAYTASAGEEVIENHTETDT